MLCNVNEKVLLAFLECLVLNHCSTCVVTNYLSVIKAYFVLYDLSFVVFEHPKIKYYIKSLKINRPLAVKSHNLIDISWLTSISAECSNLPSASVYRAIFLTGFFGFLRLSNLAPHSLAAFDPSRLLMGQDVFFSKKHVKILIKWSKTMQTRDKVTFITLPRLKDSRICPHRALKSLFDLYPMSSQTSLFQISGPSGLNPVTDSRVRKALKRVNVNLGLAPAYFTFHDFRRSGAMFAYNSHVPIQDIQRHGTWSSDCVWRYIQSDHTSGEALVNALATSIANGS